MKSLTKLESELLRRCANLILAGEWPWEPEKAAERDALISATAKLGNLDQDTQAWVPTDGTAPVTNALVLHVSDYATRSAEKVNGQVKQLKAGIVAQFEALREVGLLSVKFEYLLRRVAMCDRNASILNGARDLRADIHDALHPQRQPWEK